MNTQDNLDEKFTDLKKWWEKQSRESELRITKKIESFTKIIDVIQKQQHRLAEENQDLRFEINRLNKEIKFIQGKELAANLIIQNCKTDNDMEDEGGIKKNSRDV